MWKIELPLIKEGKRMDVVIDITQENIHIKGEGFCADITPDGMCVKEVTEDPEWDENSEEEL